MIIEKNNAPLKNTEQTTQINSSFETSKGSKIRNFAEAWINKQPLLYNCSESGNFVFKILDIKGNDIAYFKMGKYTGIMETLVWEIAQCMGLERHFVKTEWVIFKNLEQNVTLQNSTPKKTIGIWKSVKNGKQKIANVKFPLKGSLQPKEEGIRLSEYLFKLEKNLIPPIPKSEIVLAGLVAWIFGMSDAHLANMFFKENKITFFDNTKSFSNPEGLTCFKNRFYLASFRCSLLDFPESAEKWNEEEINQFVQMLENCEKNFSCLENYLEQESVKKTIQNLPKGWFNRSIVEAFKIRISFAKKTIQSGKINKLIDLPIHCSPTYALSFATEFLNCLMNDESLSKLPSLEILKNAKLHTKIGYYNLKEQLLRIAVKGYNIEDLISIGSKKKNTTEKILSKIRMLYLNTPKMHNEYRKMFEAIDNAQHLYSRRFNRFADFLEVLQKKNKKKFQLKQLILCAREMFKPEVKLNLHKKEKKKFPEEYQSIIHLFVTQQNLNQTLKLCLQEVMIKAHVELIVSFIREFLKKSNIPKIQTGEFLEKIFNSIECQFRLNTQEARIGIPLIIQKQIRKLFIKNGDTGQKIEDFFLLQPVSFYKKSSNHLLQEESEFEPQYK